MKRRKFLQMLGIGAAGAATSVAVAKEVTPEKWLKNASSKIAKETGVYSTITFRDEFTNGYEAINHMREERLSIEERCNMIPYVTDTKVERTPYGFIEAKFNRKMIANFQVITDELTMTENELFDKLVDNMKSPLNDRFDPSNWEHRNTDTYGYSETNTDHHNHIKTLNSLQGVSNAQAEVKYIIEKDIYTLETSFVHNGETMNHICESASRKDLYINHKLLSRNSEFTMSEVANNV